MGQQNKIPGMPNQNGAKPETPEKSRDPREYFNPWEILRENRDMQRDMWDSVRVSVDVGKDPRDSPKEPTSRSPWDNGGRNSAESHKERDSVERHEVYADNRLEEQNSQPGHNQTESQEFPLDPRDVQVMREQQVRDWEQQKNDILEREKGKYLKEKGEIYERELLERAREV